MYNETVNFPINVFVHRSKNVAAGASVYSITFNAFWILWSRKYFIRLWKWIIFGVTCLMFRQKKNHWSLPGALEALHAVLFFLSRTTTLQYIYWLGHSKLYALKFVFLGSKHPRKKQKNKITRTFKRSCDWLKLPSSLCEDRTYHR